MKRVWMLVVLLGLLAGCQFGGGGGERSIEELSNRAAEITDQWGENDWPAIREDFDRTMENELTEEGLQEAWEQIVQAMGSYESRGEPTQVPKPGDFVVFDTPMTFAEGEMKSRVTFHPDGGVAGLFILEPDTI